MVSIAPRILLVDDDRLTLGTLGQGLRQAGYTVLEAASGREALACAKAGNDPISLAIVDYRMPGMSGVELAEQLVQRHQVPSLFLSAYSEYAIVEEAAAKGAIGYLVKPVDVTQLIPAVETALARARDWGALLQIKEQLEKALSRGRKTSTAIGIVMERRGLSEQQAFEDLRQVARSRQQRLEALADDMVRALESLNGIGKMNEQ